jgi:hypothetical protein
VENAFLRRFQLNDDHLTNTSSGQT